MMEGKLPYRIRLQMYEEDKKRLRQKNLSSKEYEIEINKLVRKYYL